MRRSKPFIDRAPPIVCKRHKAEDCERCMNLDRSSKEILRTLLMLAIGCAGGLWFLFLWSLRAAPP